MIARDSAGRCVSLLNNEPYEFSHLTSNIYSTPGYKNHDGGQSHIQRSYTSSPATPSLTHTDSYDVSLSPTTPTSSFHEMSPQMNYSTMTGEKRIATRLNYDDERLPSAELSSPPAENERSCPSSSHCLKYEVRGAYREPRVYDEESHFNQASTATEHAPKRYPCRYRDSHDCQKTFTTSGHASRHSKIHTAEKGVSCTWAGCHKKFTRSDNMKQHLETHTKERIRGSKTSITVTAAAARLHTLENITHCTTNSSVTPISMMTLTAPAGVKKSSTGRRRSSTRSDPSESYTSPPFSRPHTFATSSRTQQNLNHTNDRHLNIIMSAN